MFWRPILLANGILLAVLGLAMIFPVIADILAGNDDWQVFAMSGMITLFIGMILYLTNRGYQGEMKIRQAFLLTATSWFSMCFFAAIPLHLSDMKLSWADAFFEMASGFTTTGSTVIVGLDHAPPGILLWRAITNALGGIGIVVMALAILPMLRIGGMQLFRTESSDRSEKVLPRTPQIALTITVIFACLTLLCGWCYWIAGMSGFDALCHAIATIATGGFSTYDQSIGYFNSLTIEIVAIVFMIAGGLPLILYYQVVNGNPQALWRNSQVQVFMLIILAVALMISCWLVLHKQMTFAESFRHSLFATVTIITTTGFVTQDYALWGPFPEMLLFMLLSVGGCTGSTSGGIKIFRFQIFFETTKAQLKQLVQPHGVFVPRYEGKPIGESVVSSVMSFFLLYAFCFMLFSIAVSFYGMDFLTSASAVAQAMANVGPGLGSIVGPAGNFSSLEDGAKWLLAVAMIMGRLELFTIIVLFTPAFWNR